VWPPASGACGCSRRGDSVVSLRLNDGRCVGFEHDQRCANGNHVAGFACEANDGSADWRSQFDSGLVRHHRSNDRLFLNDVTDLDKPLADFGLNRTFAEIG